MSNTTAFGNLSTIVGNLKSLVGESQPVTDVTLDATDLTVTYADTTTSVIDLSSLGGSGGASDTTIKIDASNTTSNYDPCLKDAFHDFLAILPSLTVSYDLDLIANNDVTGSKYKRVDGKTLRFFNNSPTSNEFFYSIKDGGSYLFEIKPQEAYTMIWSTAESKWIIIPGIINVSSRPTSFEFENLPAPISTVKLSTHEDV